MSSRLELQAEVASCTFRWWSGRGEIFSSGESPRDFLDETQMLLSWHFLHEILSNSLDPHHEIPSLRYSSQLDPLNEILSLRLFYNAFTVRNLPDVEDRYA